MPLLLNNRCVVGDLQGLQTVFSAMAVFMRVETIFFFTVVLDAKFGMLSCMLAAIDTPLDWNSIVV
jgi:hypothetical protein